MERNTFLTEYLKVLLLNAERLIDNNGADFIYIKFLDEYIEYLSATKQLPPNNCLMLENPVFVSVYNKTITYLYMGTEVTAGFKEYGSVPVNELSYSVIAEITEAVLNQMKI